MSEPIPEAVPTSHDPRSQRPVKRQAVSAVGAQASALEALFARPDREIVVPASTAAGGALRGVAPPPEIVTNVQGSSAGAGSGEFHVYKASRRREYERLRLMDEETRRESDAQEFVRDRTEKREREEKRGSKNKKRRDKAKERKALKGKDEKDKSMDAETDANGAKSSENKNTTAQDGTEQSKASTQPQTGTQAPTAEPEVGVVIHDED